jgi:hypothetical protein
MPFRLFFLAFTEIIGFNEGSMQNVFYVFTSAPPFVGTLTLP